MTEYQTLREVEQELRRRRQEDPLKHVYRPHEKQIEIHKSRTTQTLVLGANRSGKSWGMVADSLFYALGRDIYAEVPEPPIQVWYIMPSLPMFRRAILPILNRLVPKAEIKRWPKRDNYIEFRNGSVLHFLSADMGQRRLQGASVHRGYMDETPDEEVHKEFLARILDTKGTLTMGFAPIDLKTFWVRDQLYNPWLAGERPDLNVIHMPIADDAGNPLVSWFTRDDIKKMEQMWPDPAVRAARMYGEFVVRAGLVFKSFTPEAHRIQRFRVPDHFARWWIVDPQYHRFASLYQAADEHGNYYVTDEYFSQDESLGARAERMAAITGKRDVRVPVYVDSANPQDTAELNWHFNRLSAPLAAIMLSEAGIVKRVEKMVLRTHALLEPDDERHYPDIAGMGQLYGAPRLMFFDDLCSSWEYGGRPMQCSRLFWEMERLSWGKDSKPDKDSADGADCCDALIYGSSVIQSGVHVEPREQWRDLLSPADIQRWDVIDAVDRHGRLFRED